jgi:sugar lactone lactonase YvrE
VNFDVDASENLYLAASERVRRVDAATGTIAVFAGNGSTGTCGDGGPAVAACVTALDVGIDGGGNVFVSGDRRVRRVDVATATIATVAGNGTDLFCGDGGAAGAACLDSPTAVAVGADGAILVLDTGNGAIRRIDADDVITTLGSGLPPCPSPLTTPSVCRPTSAGSIFTDAAHGLHVVRYGEIWRVEEATGLVTRIAGGGTSAPFCGDGGPATAACFNGIGGAAFDASGNLYIADRGNYRLRRVDAATQVVTTVPVDGSGFYYFAPLTVAVDPAGGVYLQNDFDNSLVHVDPSTGAAAPVHWDVPPGLPFIECGFNPVMHLAVDAAGNLFIADGCTIDRIDVGNHLRYTIAGTGERFPCGEPGDPLATCLSTSGIAVDASAHVFITDPIGDRLWRLDCTDADADGACDSKVTCSDLDGDHICDAFDFSDLPGLTLSQVAVAEAAFSAGTPVGRLDAKGTLDVGTYPPTSDPTAFLDRVAAAGLTLRLLVTYAVDPFPVIEVTSLTFAAGDCRLGGGPPPRRLVCRTPDLRLRLFRRPTGSYGLRVRFRHLPLTTPASMAIHIAIAANDPATSIDFHDALGDDPGETCTQGPSGALYVTRCRREP